MMIGFAHTHKAFWLVLLILFVLTLIFRKQKVTPMLLRISYLVMLITGISLLVSYKFPLQYTIKGILAVLLIGVLEMVVGRVRRGSTDKLPLFIGLAAVLFVIVILFGYNVISI